VISNIPWIVYPRNQKNSPWIVYPRNQKNSPWIVYPRNQKNSPWIVYPRNQKNSPWIVYPRKNKAWIVYPRKQTSSTEFQTGISKILAISDGHLQNARDQYFGEGSNNTKGAGKLGSLPNHKGCQCSTKESKAGQPHRTCHRKGVLDIRYLTIHVDAGAMA
jgi:ribosomal protein L25 (general stress protein Ctc)